MGLSLSLVSGQVLIIRTCREGILSGAQTVLPFELF